MLVSKHSPAGARRHWWVWVVCAVLVSLTTTSVAFAHPADLLDDPFVPRDAHMHRGRMRPSRLPTPEETCERNKSWTKLVVCLKKGGNAVSVLYDVAGARVVAVKANRIYDTATLSIYVQKRGRWQRMSGYFVTNPTTELLGFSRLAHENGYRLEQGTIYRTTEFAGQPFPRGDQTRVDVTVRRKMTSICLDNGYCQTLITSCDGMVDGKTRWSFRASLLLDHGAVRMTGDKTYAGKVCMPMPSQLSTVGDPLD